MLLNILVKEVSAHAEAYRKRNKISNLKVFYFFIPIYILIGLLFAHAARWI